MDHINSKVPPPPLSLSFFFCLLIDVFLFHLEHPYTFCLFTLALKSSSAKSPENQFTHLGYYFKSLLPWLRILNLYFYHRNWNKRQHRYDPTRTTAEAGLLCLDSICWGILILGNFKQFYLHLRTLSIQISHYFNLYSHQSVCKPDTQAVDILRREVVDTQESEELRGQFTEVFEIAKANSKEVCLKMCCVSWEYNLKQKILFFKQPTQKILNANFGHYKLCLVSSPFFLSLKFKQFSLIWHVLCSKAISEHRFWLVWKGSNLFWNWQIYMKQSLPMMRKKFLHLDKTAMGYLSCASQVWICYLATAILLVDIPHQALVVIEFMMTKA